MQDWYSERILGGSRRQLTLVICPPEEVPRSKTGIIASRSSSHVGHDARAHRPSVRSNTGVPVDRFQRLSRRQELSVDHGDRLSLLQTRSDTKLRCLTTKRKENIHLRTTKSETLHLQKLLEDVEDDMKLDYIIRSFESIEVDDEYATLQRNRHLKLLIDLNDDPSTRTFVIIQNLKEFKESCLLYHISAIK